VALFDAGPMQLGAPRIVHLAALIVLFHRAERAATRFSWGILQRPDEALIDGLTAANVRRLLGARTARLAEPAHLVGWQTALALAPGDELWLVGDDDLETAGLPHLAVREELAVSERQVRVSLRRGPGRATELHLSLPAHAESARLLRDPYEVVVAARSRSRLSAPPASNPLFSADGRRILVRTSRGGVDSLAIPNSPRQPPGPTSRFQPVAGEEVVAAGSWGRALVVVVVDRKASTVGLVTLGKNGGLRDAQRFGPLPVEDLPVGGPRLGQCHRAQHSAGDLFVFTDGGQRAFFLWQQGLTAGPTVEALISQHGKPAYVASGGDPARRRLWEWASEKLAADGAPIDSFVPIGPSMPPRADGSAFFGHSEGRYALVFSEADSMWHSHRCGKDGGWRSDLLQAFDGDEVVGTMSPDHDSALIVLDRARRTLSTVKRSGGRSLPPSTSAITYATVATGHPMLAYVNTGQELVVINSRSADVLLKVGAGT
jgi:hypothetical protein